MWSRTVIFCFALVWSVSVSAPALSAGFYLFEQSSKASGRAFAGSAAATDDVGTVFYNPAGMTELSGAQAAVGGYTIIPNARITDQDSSLTVGAVPEMPVGGTPDGQGFSAQPIGNFSVAAPITSKLWLGVAGSVPFGIRGNYDPDFFGRYDSIKSTLIVAELAPTLAYRVNDFVSLGASVGMQYADTTLSNALPNPMAPGGPSPATDGRLTVKGSDWTPSFAVGVHIRATARLDLGLSFRSAVSHTLSGKAITEFAGTTTTQGASADLDLPEVVSAGLAYQLTPRFTLLGQVNYFGWSRFEEVRITFEDGTETATEERFADTWSFSLGADVRVSQAWNLRGGLQYDETPTRDAFRSTRIPDADRLWATMGVTYRISGSTAVDVSYAHMFAKKAPINRVNSFPALGTTVRTQGMTKTRSNVVGMSLRARF